MEARTSARVRPGAAVALLVTLVGLAIACTGVLLQVVPAAAQKLAPPSTSPTQHILSAYNTSSNAAHPRPALHSRAVHGPNERRVPASGIEGLAGGSANAAETATAGERATAVIGRQVDTAVAKDWAGHEVLDLPANEWTLAKNDKWVQSVVERKMPVYVGSPTTWPNLWDAAAGRSTVFGRELQQFTDAGYTWDGWTMLPPGGG